MVIFVIKESSSYGVCFLIRQGSRENAPNSSSCNYRRGKRRSISVRIDYWGRKWKVGFKEAYRRPPPSSSSQGQRLMVKGHNPSPILFLSSKSQYCGKQEVEKRKRTVAQKAIQSLYRSATYAWCQLISKHTSSTSLKETHFNHAGHTHTQKKREDRALCSIGRHTHAWHDTPLQGKNMLHDTSTIVSMRLRVI